MMGGDFNCALNPDFDRNGNQDSSHNQSRKIFLNIMEDLGLCDVWRERNPDKREFSFVIRLRIRHSQDWIFYCSLKL